jgi:hypothetical protein
MLHIQAKKHKETICSKKNNDLTSFNPPRQSAYSAWSTVCHALFQSEKYQTSISPAQPIITYILPFPPDNPGPKKNAFIWLQAEDSWRGRWGDGNGHVLCAQKENVLDEVKLEWYAWMVGGTSDGLNKRSGEGAMWLDGEKSWCMESNGVNKGWAR